jgi:hypothetical protein
MARAANCVNLLVQRKESCIDLSQPRARRLCSVRTERNETEMEQPLKFREEANGDLTVIPDSAADFHRFLRIKVPGKRVHLFKYSRVTPNLLGSLRENYLWMSKPSDFNDPFDAKVIIDYRLTPEEVDRHAHWRGDRPAQSSDRKVVPLVGEDEYSFASRYAVDATDIQPHDARSLKKMLNIAKLAERSAFLDNILGVCCFTEDPLNILMWSHYAANHSGVCLRFRHRSSADLSEHCFPVQYRRTVWACRSKPDDAPAQARALIRSVLIKSTVWEYEREWRLVSFESGKSHFDPGDLNGVILGVRISDEDRRRVVSELERKDYAHVEVLQVYQHPLKYTLRILRKSEAANMRTDSAGQHHA